ncbi:hypothetical protein [Pseudosporangium ferrugineum]|uniref:Uncharacterized protein n=1 Tax=Pseudosporangium ferrugineum TaxID=439699 RepID=A0A2T0R315_9ACTN|nr:hypothetical protein [Pseudosporangium ferrugineum]PRY14442.1 hypothetical protein CLV70_1692 [Pseudosporangium ferrugineum]
MANLPPAASRPWWQRMWDRLMRTVRLRRQAAVPQPVPGEAAAPYLEPPPAYSVKPPPVNPPPVDPPAYAASPAPSSAAAAWAAGAHPEFGAARSPAPETGRFFGSQFADSRLFTEQFAAQWRANQFGGLSAASAGRLGGDQPAQSPRIPSPEVPANLDFGTNNPYPAEFQLHRDSAGKIYDEPQTHSGQWNEPVTTTSPVRRSDVDLRYVAKDGKILTPEEFGALDSDGKRALVRIDANAAKIGFVTPDRQVFTSQEAQHFDRSDIELRPIDMSQAKIAYAEPDGKYYSSAADGRRRELLDPDSRFMSSDARIYSGDEVSSKKLDGMSKVDGSIDSRYVPENGHHLYTPEQAEAMGYRSPHGNLREVDRAHIDVALEAPTGEIFDGRDPNIVPERWDNLREVDRQKVNIGHVSPGDGVIFDQPLPGTRPMDLDRRDVRYRQNGIVLEAGYKPGSHQGVDRVDYATYKASSQHGFAAAAGVSSTTGVGQRPADASNRSNSAPHVSRQGASQSAAPARAM